MRSTPAAEVMRDLLAAYRLSATVYPEAASCGSWTLGAAAAGKAVFHLVARGACRIEPRGRAPLELEAGDLALLPRNLRHSVSGAAPGAGIVCGCFDFQDARGNPLLQALPDVVVVRAREPADRKRIADLGALLGAEAAASRPGGSVVLERLVELLLALAVRGHLESSEEKRGFVAMLADPRVGRALAAIHREPERDWHIGALAALAGMSRTAFVRAFSAGVGQPPMHYLAEWRMRRAAALLRDRRNSIGAVAARLGYRSEAAFRRAFKRVAGIAPGALRPGAPKTP